MANSTLSCSSVDSDFGPSVVSPCSSFDFTFTFEDSILSILPSSIFLLSSLPRFYFLRQSSRKVGNGSFKAAKLVIIFILICINLALLALKTVLRIYPLSIISSILSLLDATSLLILSNVEHDRSIQPSPLISFYLLISSLCDAINLRSRFIRGNQHHAIPVLSTVALGLKVSIFFFESRSKESNILSKGLMTYGPEEISDVFRNGFFVWINRLLIRGFRSILSPSDLFPLPQALQTRALHDNFQTEWKSAERGNGSTNLARCILWFSKQDIAVTVISRLVLLSFTLLQPLTMNALLTWLETKIDSRNMNLGYGLIAAYGFIYLGIALSTGIFWRYQLRWVTKLRGILISLLYSRVLESKVSDNVKNDAFGSLNVDIENFLTGMREVHEVYANVLQIGIATWMIEKQVAIGSVTPIVIAFFCGLAIYRLSKYIAPYQQKLMRSTHKRLNNMTFLLRFIKEIKFSGLEKISFNVAHELREEEIVAGGSYRNLLVAVMGLAYTPSCLSPILTFAIFVRTQRNIFDTLHAATLFTSASLISLITLPLIALFQIVPSLVSAWNSLNRIQTSLMKPDHLDQSDTVPPTSPPEDASLSLRASEGNVFKLWNANLCYSTGSTILKDVSINIPKSSITAITGPIGCGKSTLLKSLLGETSLLSGRMDMSCDIHGYAYCDQEPWLVGGSIRDNIVGYSTSNNPAVDAEWYKTSLWACCLEEDLDDLADGDDTQIGSNGSVLSGGQKQRIALARAIYSRKEVVILDDSFNALDLRTAQMIGVRLFGSQGIWRRIGTTVVMVTQTGAILDYADQIITITTNGAATVSGDYRALSSRYTGSEDLAKKTQPQAISSCMNSIPSRELHSKQTTEKATAPTQSKKTKINLQQAKGSIIYLKSIGSMRVLIFLVLLVSQSFFTTFPSLWLKWWLGAITRENSLKVAYHLGLYSAFQVLGLGFVIMAAYHVCRVVTPYTGRQFHQILLKTTISSTLASIAQMDAGSVLNRFSEDIRLIDSVLPINLLNASEGLFNTIAQAILIAVSSLYVFISFPIILGVIILIQRFYLRTSRRLRLLDLEGRSPLYAHFMETISGLITIRAFGWQAKYQEKLFNLLDQSQKPFYLLFMVQRWLSVVLDLLTTVIAILVVGLAVALRSNSGLTGVALVNVMAITETLQLLIMQSSSLETSLGAVSRTEDYAKMTEIESTDENTEFDLSDWPPAGSICFDKVSVRHVSDKPEVLHHITFKLPPGSKVGIFGRTGSGKSSLISTLLGMTEITSGSVVIDGIDISQVPPLRLRSSIIGLPQQDCIIPGLSLRENLAPTQPDHNGEGPKPDDERIVCTLKTIALWEKIRSFYPDSKSDTDVLDVSLSSDNSDEMMLTPGQTRLLSLARAILRVRPGSIVVLDEPMSVMDAELRNQIRSLFSKRDGPFGQCTVLMVQHHIDTLLDFDVVLFLANGGISELGDPRALLKNKHGKLRRLWDANFRHEGAI